MSTNLNLIKGMITGNPGIGKTVVLGSAADEPRLGNGLFVDFEANIASIRSKLFAVTLDQLIKGEIKFEPKKLARLHITELRDLDKLLDFLYKDDGNIFQSTYIDSAGEINYLSLAENTAANHKKSKADGKPKGDGVKPLIGDYGDSSAEMRKLFREFRDLGTNVFFTCHAAEQKDEHTGIVEIQPKLTGQLKSDIPGMLQLVGYMRVADKDDKAREIVFQPTKKLSMVKNQFEGSEMDTLLLEKGAPAMKLILDGLGL